MAMIETEYLIDVFDKKRLVKTINYLEKHIESFSKKSKFNAIAFRGVSGAAVAFTLSYKLKIPVVCIRKGSSHSPFSVEGAVMPGKYIIVDDLVDTGKTVRSINNNMRNRSVKNVCVGVFCYSVGADYCFGDTIKLSGKKVPIFLRKRG